MAPNQQVEEFKKRTKAFALKVIRFSKALPKSDEIYVLKRQLLRSSTSVAANYRAACRARSRAEFYSKMCIVVEEADETMFWLELFEEGQLASSQSIQPLRQEALEILKITSKARKSAKENLKQ